MSNGRSGRLPGGKPANVCAPDLPFVENAERGERVVTQAADSVLGSVPSDWRPRRRRSALVGHCPGPSSPGTPVLRGRSPRHLPLGPHGRRGSPADRAADAPLEQQIQRAHIDRFPSRETSRPPSDLPRVVGDPRMLPPGRSLGPLPEARGRLAYVASEREIRRAHICRFPYGAPVGPPTRVGRASRRHGGGVPPHPSRKRRAVAAPGARQAARPSRTCSSPLG